jgi:hypothetical protein
MENHAWLQNFLLQNKNRKVYMLFELDPSREVTGGAWYTEQDYDAEFVDVVKQQCLHFILKQGLASLEDVAESVRKSGITQVELRLEEFKQILDTLVLDGDIEEVVGGAPSSSHAPETVCYRASRSRIPETSALTSVPCGICPVPYANLKLHCLFTFLFQWLFPNFENISSRPHFPISRIVDKEVERDSSVFLPAGSAWMPTWWSHITTDMYLL